MIKLFISENILTVNVWWYNYTEDRITKIIVYYNFIYKLISNIKHFHFPHS